MNLAYGHQIRKSLSANDLGLTGSHQAGVLVPRVESILSFFPRLDSSMLNPRINLPVIDEMGSEWKFVLIHYNNRLVASGTRNEYRLTHMTGFLRNHGARPGDVLSLERSGGHFQARVEREISLFPERTSDDVLRLSGSWRVVRINR